MHHNDRYDSLSKIFHWITAITVLATFVLGPGDFGQLMRAGIDPGTQPNIVWHESLGISIFVLTCLRLIWNIARPHPPKHQMRPWMHRLSKVMHYALWMLLLALPMTALLALGSESHPLTLLNGLRINELPWIASSSISAIADWGEVHKFAGDTLVSFAGIHAFAALYHHFRLNDKVLMSMLP